MHSPVHSISINLIGVGVLCSNFRLLRSKYHFYQRVVSTHARVRNQVYIFRLPAWMELYLFIRHGPRTHNRICNQATGDDDEEDSRLDICGWCRCARCSLRQRAIVQTTCATLAHSRSQFALSSVIQLTLVASTRWK